MGEFAGDRRPIQLRENRGSRKTRRELARPLHLFEWRRLFPLILHALLEMT